MMTRSEPQLLRAQAQAAKVLHDLGVDDPSTVDIEDIAAHLDAFVREGNLSGAEARLVRRGSEARIRVREGIASGGQRRFAISHELGHLQLHENDSQIFVCLSSDIHGYAGSNQELEANEFGAELLMPKALIRRRYGDSARTLDLVEQVSNDMLTSFTATAARLIEASKDGYLAVFSKEGKVYWWRRSPGLSGVWLQRRQQVDRDSTAWAAEQGARPTRRPQGVRPEAWFEHVDRCERFEVYEQSMLLGSYGFVVTILSCLEREDEW